MELRIENSYSIINLHGFHESYKTKNVNLHQHSHPDVQEKCW